MKGIPLIFVMFVLAPEIFSSSRPALANQKQVCEDAEDNFFSARTTKQSAHFYYNCGMDRYEYATSDHDFGMAEQEKRYAHAGRAISYYNLAILTNPNFADAYYQRAVARDYIRNISGAIIDAQKAAQLYRRQSNSDSYQKAVELQKYLPTRLKYNLDNSYEL
jgi:hypothetical protein